MQISLSSSFSPLSTWFTVQSICRDAFNGHADDAAHPLRESARILAAKIQPEGELQQLALALRDLSRRADDDLHAAGVEYAIILKQRRDIIADMVSDGEHLFPAELQRVPREPDQRMVKGLRAVPEYPDGDAGKVPYTYIYLADIDRLQGIASLGYHRTIIGTIMQE